MPPKTSVWSGITQGLHTAGPILGSLAMGGLLGWFIGTKIPSAGPWPLLAGLVFGLMLGTWQALREVSQK